MCAALKFECVKKNWLPDYPTTCGENKIPTNGRRFVGMVVSSHQIDARGGAEGSGDGRQDGNDEMQDFLYEFFFVHVFYV